ncbi:Cytochrome c-type protein TorC [Vibrio stylophorae]|uniref:Cytochrome c-type protein n=1 Tax=Vibrio stylophorae TaxID=659351 RepID=A0ABM8ZRX5_9VIBR|nr:pentaheme c-type cytochrome TorC [Vibrio stylophorae]CAH0533052.1 Cytochrome c-type protein TorC [Vibrio stylophorae]
MKKLWRILRSPSSKYSLLALLLAGAGITLAGVIALHKGFEYTSSIEFCTSCHTMQQNYAEYKESIHFKNASGVRATCADCHQAKDFPRKVLRKLEASKDLYHHFVTKKIDTPEQFEEHRLEMAQKVWARMSRQKSTTCKSCHSYEAMDHSKQSAKAAFEMNKAAAADMNCIECHKGIAHELPNMAGGFKKAFQDLETQSANVSPDAKTLFSISEKDLYATDDASKEVQGTLLPASQVTVLEHKGDMIKVQIDGWLEKQGKGRVMTEYMGKRVFKATIRGEVKEHQQILGEETDPTTHMVWQHVRVTAWMKQGNMLTSIQPVWNYAADMYRSTCNACHAAPDPAHFTANGWISGLSAMSAYYRLDKTEERTLLKYLQNHGKDTGGAGHH